jgi:hypothetical protein
MKKTQQETTKHNILQQAFYGFSVLSTTYGQQTAQHYDLALPDRQRKTRCREQFASEAQ